jgi:type I site-specific restriction endonuclease
MKALNLPTYLFNIKSEKGRKYILDVIRRKYVALTPEEWVRQNFIRYLAEDKGFPLTLMAVEAGFALYKTTKRTDVLIYNRQAQPVAIVECKAPEVALTQTVFEQIVRYNLSFNLDYLFVTNGMVHYCCRLNHENGQVEFLQDIPRFEQLIQD